jgi:glycosyltransferase involved in cell wall biosynthesis
VRIQPEGLVVLFAAEAVRQNVWKDYQTVQEAVRLTAEHMSGGDVLFVALGHAGAPERIGSGLVRFEPYETDPRTVACYYQAADVYVHAARADTFPSTILEALACGTPVAATAVGGIPEQVEDGRTGFLVAPGDPHALAERLTQLLSDPVLRARMGGEAAAAARRQFDLDRQADAYLAWYRELIHQRAAERPATGR